jgi:hypothetical protein
MQPQRKPQQRAIGAPRLVGRYDPPEPEITVIDSAPEPPPPPKKKIGRPTKHAVAMTDAQRKQLQRKRAVIDEILHEILVDHRSGGAYGPGRYIKDADQGKGLLVTGGYDSAKLEAVDAQHNRPLLNPSRGKPSGAGPDIEAEMKFGEQFFTGRYTASFNHSWDLYEEQIEWKRILDRMMVETTVCLLCPWNGQNTENLVATAEEIHEHEKMHPSVPRQEGDCVLGCALSHQHERTRPLVRQEGEAITMDELRCCVCGFPGTDHILECELTSEEKEHNENCKLDLFKQAGIQPKKMSEMDTDHRRAIKAIRKVLRAVRKALVGRLDRPPLQSVVS